MGAESRESNSEVKNIDSTLRERIYKLLNLMDNSLSSVAIITSMYKQCNQRYIKLNGPKINYSKEKIINELIDENEVELITIFSKANNVKLLDKDISNKNVDSTIERLLP